MAKTKNEDIEKPEDKARHEHINPLLKKAGWKLQNYKNATPKGEKYLAVEYFQMGGEVGEADYVLFINGQAVGIIEAKKQGETLIGKEPQVEKYSQGFPKEFDYVDLPLPFNYTASGSEFYFTNKWDPKPRSREIFAFHQPETLEKWIKNGKRENLRNKLSKNKPYKNKKLWSVQKKAINNIKESLANSRLKALIQMATGSGKTFTAVNLCYDLIKNYGAKKILFLVDRGYLGNQTKQEFENFETPDDGRKFSELYDVQRMESNKIDPTSNVCISTIQRMYSILKGKKLDPEKEDEDYFMPDPDMEAEPLEYNPKIPMEEFDVIIVDECHRSIYNLWRQVLDYFDSFLIGLTATPSKSTIGFFDSNLVMEYTHDLAVADNVNVDFDVYKIRTHISEEGSVIDKGETILKRDMRTRKKRWETLEDEVEYTKNQLDRAVVAKDQIRKIIRTFRDKVKTKIFPGRDWVPKTLIFAKDDNHAEEIVKIVREEFNEGNDFAVKITYKTEGEKPHRLIKQFRNDPMPRIAVTVDMVSTGTDIKPLEIVFFMRPVKSRLLYEQMKGRGVRVIKNDDFKTVTPDSMGKERFVIVDAVGVTENENLNETRPLEQLGEKKVSFDKLLRYLQFGKPKIEHISSMASRLSRLNKKLTDKQKQEIEKMTNRKSLNEFSKSFVQAIDLDKIHEQAKQEFGEGKEGYEPKKKEIKQVTDKRINQSLKDFVGNSKLIQRLPEIKKETEQIIDTASIDTVEEAEFSKDAREKAEKMIGSFKDFIKENKGELQAINIFYKNKGKLKWKDLTSLADKISAPPYVLTPKRLWFAYKQLEQDKVRGDINNKKITNFISLLKHEIKNTKQLEPYLDTVEKRFAEWLGRQKEQGNNFTQEQLNWLEKIKQEIANNAEIAAEDFESGKLQQMGGLGQAVEVFGGQKHFTEMIEVLNERVGGV